MVGVTQEQEIGSDGQLRKKKRTHGLARRSEQLDIAIASVRDPRGRGGCTKDDGAHEDVRCKSKRDRCGRKGHFLQECTLEVECVIVVIRQVISRKIAHN